MKQILIVDDALTVRMFHRQLVTAIGHGVVEAENGVEALEKLAQAPCDLMLVDVNMPFMDGYRFIRSVRESAEWCDIPAIMISTEAKPDDRRQAYAAGANFYLVKPTDPQHLEKLIVTLLGHPEPEARAAVNRETGACS
ncbi:response regulator [Kushneria aurantia]|uniref:Response regulator n=1 Tax=Kushneria aurantia TaxID=504092 RepID=A0ABV6G781_9GAMM|nr:response regulator [Kushneria aurantia]